MDTTVPLLEANSGDGDYAAVKTFGEVRAMFMTETVKLWRIAAPIAFNILCLFGLNTSTVIFAGHLGAVELAGVTIAVSVIGSFTFGFMLGMGSALETLCGQAFGAGKVSMLGVYLQRSWIVLFGASLVILPVYIFSGPLLKLLGQEDDIADLAGTFNIIIIPRLFALAIIFPTQKFLQAQSKVRVLALIGFVALVVHVLMLWLFIFVFDWGVLGAAVAFDISSWGIAIAQVSYVMCRCEEGWKGFSWLAFNEIWAFVRLSLASAVMICLEAWYMTSIVLLTGHLSDAVIAVGSLSICTNINALEAMVFIGINAAISVRVSNELGKGRPRTAKYSVYITVFQSFLIGIVFMIIVMIFRNYISYIFTTDEELRQAVAHLAYLLGVTLLLNSIQPVISGVAIGAGWQALVAYINLGCYYVFGLPLGYLLGYTANLGVMGIWGGMICGVALQTCFLIVILYKTNWNKEVEQTSERMRKWGGQAVEREKIADTI